MTVFSYLLKLENGVMATPKRRSVYLLVSLFACVFKLFPTVISSCLFRQESICVQPPPGNNIHSSVTLRVLLPFSLYAWSKIVHLYLNKYRRQSDALVSICILQFWLLSLRDYDLLHITYSTWLGLQLQWF